MSNVDYPSSKHTTHSWRFIPPPSFFMPMVLIAALGLLLADMLMFWFQPAHYSVPVGNFRDKYFLEGVHRQETAEDGQSYRWTEAHSTLWLNHVRVGDYSLLTLDIGGRPEPAQLRISLRDQPWLEFTAQTTARHYSFLLPHDANQQIWLGIDSPTFQVAGDPRQLGVKLQAFTITNIYHGPPFPPLEQYLSQLLLLIFVGLIMQRLEWRWPAQAAILAGLALALALVLSRELLQTMEYLPRLTVAVAVLMLLTWLVLPPLERWLIADRVPNTGLVQRHELYVLWALMLAGCAIRLAGVLYPSFGGQDLGRNLDRLSATMNGQLYIIAPSGEFAKGLTIYPTGPYLALMPGVLATTDTASLMQGGLALMDGLTALLTSLLVYRLGGNAHAARLALVLYAGNIAAFGAMSYSFSAQIFGQWFSAPLALLLLYSEWPPRPRTWVLAIILMLFGVFSHIGVAILALAWMGLILLLTTFVQRRIPWWGWGLFVLACLLSFGFLYVEIVGPTLEHASEKVVPRSVGSGTLFKGWRMLLLNGLRIGYSDIGLVLLPFGLLLFGRYIRSGIHEMGKQWVVVVAWLLATLFFLGVDLVLDVQVRYFYFALPLVLALIALPLGWVSARTRLGALAAWGIVLLIIVPQVMLWFSATWGEGKIPMTPLTH